MNAQDIGHQWWQRQRETILVDIPTKSLALTPAFITVYGIYIILIFDNLVVMKPHANE